MSFWRSEKSPAIEITITLVSSRAINYFTYGPHAFEMRLQREGAVAVASACICSCTD